MPAIGAGALDRLIAIEQPTLAGRTDSGQKQTTWTTVARVWANREDLSGEERFVAQQVASHVTTRWTIHHRTDVSPEMRIRDLGDPVLMDGALGRLHDISAALDADGRRMWLQILARVRSETTDDA